MNNPGPVHGLTAENFLASFPVALQGDQSPAALADVTARLLARRPGEVDRLRLYSAIDQMDEQLLDILAYDFKVDWWDADYSLEEKRQTLKDSWRVHKTLGTRAAVETAISAIYPETTVEEWFEYGGEPYHFRIRINITSDSGDTVRQRRVLERLNFYKSLRSHVESLKYFLKPEKALAAAGAALAGSQAQQRLMIPILPGVVQAPCACAEIQSTGGVLSLYSRVAVRLHIPAIVGPQHGSAAAGACAAVCGQYQKIVREVPIHGSLE